MHTGPLILTQSPEGRLFEIDDAAQFERSMDQVTDPRVAVVIQGRADPADPWTDLLTFWSGPFRRDLPTPRLRDIADVGTRAGARQARSVVRSTI